MRTDEMTSMSCGSSSHSCTLTAVFGVGREGFEGTAKAIGMISGSVETRGSRTRSFMEFTRHGGPIVSITDAW